MKYRHIRLLFTISLVFCLLSCVNTKKLNVVWVFKNQVIYENTADSNGKAIIIKDSIIKPLTVKLTKVDSVLSITMYEGKVLKDTLKLSKTALLPNGLFFPYVEQFSGGSSTFVGSKKLVYLSSSPVLQALTIPVKVRFATSGYPYEAEASINLAIAFGWKFTHTVYRNFYHRKTGLFVSSVNNHYSITPGLFVGPSIVELTSQNSLSSYDRNVLSLAYGAMLVFGLNRLNIGIALGLDDALGNDDKNWIYQGKPWLGATISFDLIQ
jgi:hypothetical protein